MTSAVPYLARLSATIRHLAGPVHDAANKALMQLGITAPVNVSDAFYALAEKQYYGNSSIASDTRNPMAFVWYWDATKGLYKIDVPHAIFNDIMTMRQTEARSRPARSRTTALAPVAHRELQAADEPEGRPEGRDAAGKLSRCELLGCDRGSQYLNDALARRTEGSRLGRRAGGDRFASADRRREQHDGRRRRRR